jgi:hypothetical protein
MTVACTLLDGTVVHLDPVSGMVAAPWGFDIHTNQTIYHVYVAGATGVSDGQGG